MKIALGADPWGLDLKNDVKGHLEKAGHDVLDVGMADAGSEIPYYKVAAEAARRIQRGEAERGILFCGTGMGVAVVANKFKGIYAGVVESEFTARMCRAVNNANVLTLGGMIVAPYIAKRAVDAWLETAHTQGLEELSDFLRNALEEIAAIEDANMS